MATTRSSSYTTVIGIDFGTGGYAIAIGYTRSNWIIQHETARHGVVYKNSAALLGRAEFHTNRYAEGDIEFVQLGYDALSSFAEIAEPDKDSFVLFPSAKMSLYNADSSDALAQAVNGATAPAADIIRLALTQIRAEALKRVSFSSDVLWVITVPAIWSDTAKQIMREAAIKAGIPDRHLIFALEPETASIACRMNNGPDPSVEPFDTTSSYMVVDAGKGTVDITVHRVDNNRLSDVTIPRGGACGSGDVDVMFLQLMNKCFSPEAIDDFKNAMPNTWLEIMSRWERLKCHGDIYMDKTRSLEIGQKFLFHVRHACDARSETEIPAGVTIDDRFGYLEMSPECIQSLFKPSLDRIYELVSESLADRNVRESCKTLFLVGGYASCPFLRSTVERAIRDAGLKIEVMRPLEPHLSVVKGAILYGLDPDILSARIMQRTIAVAVAEPFDAAAHEGKTCVEYAGQKFCTDCLDVLVRRGQKVKSKQTVEHVYSPLISDRNVQNVSVVKIYNSIHDEIKFVSDPDVNLAGELIVKIPPDVSSDQVRVRLSFGSTESKASASMDNGMPVQCVLDFYNLGRSRRRGQDVISVDVCFVMDCTGSMAAYIDAAKEQLLQIGDSVIKQLSSRDEVCTLRFAFVGYRDFCDPVSDRLTSIDFTNDFYEVKEFISRQEAFGGGDGPEDLLGGLNHAATLNWTAKNRFIVLSADAPCHGADYSGSNSGDSYPEGNPDGLKPETVLQNISALKTQLLFTRITNFTEIMIDKFREMHPISEIDMSSTNCINQFGRSLTTEIVGYIKKHETH